MSDPARALKQAEREFHEAEERLLGAMTDAMCETYKQITGRPAADRLRQRLWDALQFNI